MNIAPPDKDIRCPVCGQPDAVVPILYGDPTIEAWQQSEQGLIKLGGCLITDDSHLFYCKRDDHEFS